MCMLSCVCIRVYLISYLSCPVYLSAHLTLNSLAPSQQTASQRVLDWILAYARSIMYSKLRGRRRDWWCGETQIAEFTECTHRNSLLNFNLSIVMLYSIYELYQLWEIVACACEDVSALMISLSAIVAYWLVPRVNSTFKAKYRPSAHI